MPETDIKKIFGKRLKASKPLEMELRFPGSGQVRTLPAGKPSPKINSFIRGKYYELNCSDTAKCYVKKQPGITVVDPSAEDDSSYLSIFNNTIDDWLDNTRNTAVGYAGNVSEGFSKSVTGVSQDLFSFGDWFKTILFMLISLVSIILILTIINR